MVRKSNVVKVQGVSLAAAAWAGPPEGERPDPIRFAHATTEAYPGAMVSLKYPDSGLTFYVESDGRKLVAIDAEGRPAWGLDVLAETDAEVAVGKPVIRHLRVQDGKLNVTLGKHTYVQVDVATGKAAFVGAG